MIAFKVTLTGWPAMKKRDLNQIMKEAWQKAGILYHRKMLPKRFTEEGGRELHYRGRTPKYMRRKKALKGHRLPFVWSGVTRDMSKLEDIRPYSVGGEGGVKIVTHSRVLNFNPELLREFTSISEGERRQIEGLLQKEIERGIARAQNREVEHIG